MPRNKKVEDFRRIYLFLYNLSQFIGFLYVLTTLNVEYMKKGPVTIERAYDVVGPAIRFLQIMQLLEVVHPLLRYTSGTCLMPFIQVMGRIFMIFAMINAEPRMHTKPAVFYLIYIYSVIEVFRYPYYMLKIYNMDVQLITWLRYTMWIPLYPIGFICEGVIMLRNIPYYEETRKFSLALPNAANFSFYFPTLMRLYLLFGLFPCMYFMMSHMSRQRRRVLSHDKIN